MKNSLVSVFAGFWAITGFSQTYITDVTLADVEKHRMLPGKTVVINGTVITDVKSGKVPIPVGATVIDGSGKFLMPGMTDAHVHFFQNGGLYARPDAIDLRYLMPYDKEIKSSHDNFTPALRRYLANGITTVIDPGATYHFLKHKQELAGQTQAATVLMSGPLLTTYLPEVYKDLGDDAPFHLVQTPDDARKMVREQLAHKPDFIKIWYIANGEGKDMEATARKYLPVVQAIIDESHKNNIKVAVHATELFTATLSAESGCDYLVHSVEDQLIPDSFVQLLKKKKVVLCPTLVVSDGYEDTFGQKLNISNHDLRMADPHQMGSLLDLKHLADTALVNAYRKYTVSDKQLKRVLEANSICMKNLKKLADGGVTIATGTDAGNIGTLHASSYLDEILRMREAGLSNWQILEASTLGGAKVLGKQQSLGSIAKGKKADLVLLDADPSANIENVTKINKVIHNGVVLQPEKLLVETPEQLVQRQLNAYNFRNIEAFLDTYADDVEVYTFPEKLDFKGKETMRKIYADMFLKTPNLHCELKGRIVRGNIVIDNEHVTFGSGSIDGVAIYHVENGKIKKVYFLP
ncbi:Adenine deaminase [Flavobacterium longum]|uniref:amidohydrolase family protein n=1 Tax=Flavobacterium longum TaxID=1299340 RepID=UPI0039ED86D7